MEFEGWDCGIRVVEFCMESEGWLGGIRGVGFCIRVVRFCVDSERWDVVWNPGGWDFVWNPRGGVLSGIPGVGLHAKVSQDTCLARMIMDVNKLDTSRSLEVVLRIVPVMFHIVRKGLPVKRIISCRQNPKWKVSPEIRTPIRWRESEGWDFM